MQSQYLLRKICVSNQKEYLTNIGWFSEIFPMKPILLQYRLTIAIKESTRPRYLHPYWLSRDRDMIFSTNCGIVMGLKYAKNTNVGRVRQCVSFVDCGLQYSQHNQYWFAGRQEFHTLILLILNDLFSFKNF